MRQALRDLFLDADGGLRRARRAPGEEQERPALAPRMSRAHEERVEQLVQPCGVRQELETAQALGVCDRMHATAACWLLEPPRGGTRPYSVPMAVDARVVTV